MINEKISEKFENGTVVSSLSVAEITMIEWNEHSLFKGVYLKHLIKGIDTEGSLSCHLVKVNPGCILDTHVHIGKLEIHSILEGNGNCIIGERATEYVSGTVSIIPADTTHKVIAGNEGLFMLATFSPALL